MNSKLSETIAESEEAHFASHAVTKSLAFNPFMPELEEYSKRIFSLQKQIHLIQSQNEDTALCFQLSSLLQDSISEYILFRQHSQKRLNQGEITSLKLLATPESKEIHDGTRLLKILETNLDPMSDRELYYLIHPPSKEDTLSFGEKRIKEISKELQICVSARLVQKTSSISSLVASFLFLFR